MSINPAQDRDRTNWSLLGALRFVLAGIVLCAHMTVYFPNNSPLIRAIGDCGAKAAVMGFFLVSGYSIAASLKRHPTGYYRRRLSRIYPVYIVAILGAYILERTVHGDLVMPLGAQFHASGLFTAVMNGLFLQTFLVKPVAYNSPVWSLAIEVSYYAVAPLFTRLPRWMPLPVIAVSALAYIAPRSDQHGMVYYLFTHFNMLTYAWAWFMGYYLFTSRKPLVVAGFAVLGAALIYANPYLNPEPYAIETFVVALGLVIAAAAYPSPSRDSLLHKVPNFLGNISYPLYLFQYPLALAAFAFLGIENIPILLALCIGGSVAGYYLIDVYARHAVARVRVPGWRAGMLARPGMIWKHRPG